MVSILLVSLSSFLHSIHPASGVAKNNSVDFYAQAKPPQNWVMETQKRFHPDTPLLQQYRQFYFQSQTPDPYWITLYSYKVEVELQNLHQTFNFDLFSAELALRLKAELPPQKAAGWERTLPQARQNRLFLEAESKAHQTLTAAKKPRTGQEMKDFVEALRQKANDLKADFGLSESIVTHWHQALAPDRSIAEKVEALKKLESFFSTSKDHPILEAIKLAQGFLYLDEGKFEQARQIALEGEQSDKASARHLSSLLRSDAQFQIGGYPAPSFHSQITEGENKGELFDLQAQKGKVVLLYFWQSWCPPCAKKLPVLATLHENYSGRVVMVGISDARLENDPVKIPEMRQKFNNTFSQITDAGFSTEAFRIFNYPRTIIVDKEGRAYLFNPEVDVEKELKKFL